MKLEQAKAWLEGARFGRLMVIEIRREKYLLADCLCDCGVKKIARVDHLLSHSTTSCGCYAREVSRKQNTLHGSTRTRLYGVWTHIKGRCCNPTDRAYPGYGERGIQICLEWKESFESFRDWALSHGYQDDLTINRVDNDGDYVPDNCQWIPFAKQAINRRTTHWVTAFGETRSMVEWARDSRCNVSYQTLHDRLERNMPAELAISCAKMKPHDYRLGKVMCRA